MSLSGVKTDYRTLRSNDSGDDEMAVCPASFHPDRVHADGDPGRVVAGRDAAASAAARQTGTRSGVSSASGYPTSAQVSSNVRTDGARGTTGRLDERERTIGMLGAPASKRQDEAGWS